GGLARPAHPLFPTLDRVRAHVQQPRKLRLAGIERNPDPPDAAGQPAPGRRAVRLLLLAIMFHVEHSEIVPRGTFLTIARFDTPAVEPVAFKIRLCESLPIVLRRFHEDSPAQNFFCTAARPDRDPSA